MKKLLVPLVVLSIYCARTFAQSELTFKTETRSTFVWGHDAPGGAVSSIIQDPLTDTPILKLTYAGIQLSSRMGFERVSPAEAGHFLGSTTTVVNNTSSSLSVRYGGISLEGHFAGPLSVASAVTQSSKREKRMDRLSLDKLHCFTSGYLSADNLFSANSSFEQFTVYPGTATTISFVIRDPRSYGVRCSIQGCYPTGTIRYFLTVNSHDYVFVWPGQSVLNCGK